ncbi:alpha/beta hydrolase [Blastopirellula marina]|uniref:Alpha/beta hydrolase n=1 Tax=Blastopirellula marina TaxID=124 RepID=A0A2S8FMD5_9BACT|nr:MULTISPECIES: alpha/beta hydrolase [Pirellulaceae]PQO33358.1 alpha/beta hydrolase [Blastopirellula marina]RCS52447.1 alpha/beta hydrolase [Bremerella cremea]
MKSHLYKTAAGRQRLDQWYERFLAKIETPVETRTVPTRFGENQVLVTGPADAPPLVVLHAMRTGAAFLLSELGPLLTKYRVYAPELPGQSVRGLDVRLPLQDESAAFWLADVMDGLSLESANLLGVSWGGFIARLTASHMPHSVPRLALLVPAGIANGSHLTGLMKMAWPMIRYQVRPSEANLQKLLLPLLSTWDDDWGGFIACTIRDLKMDPRIPPVATDEQLKQLTMPVLAIVGEEDISFPGHLVEQRLRSQVPTAEVEVVPGMKHCPPTTPEFRTWLAQRLTAFFG